VSDLVTAFFDRLGNLGVLLLACALLLGGLAGAAVVHHYDSLTADTVATQQHKEKDQPKQAKKPKHDKQRPGQKPGQKQNPQGDQETD
jgi:hypothetical protein